jgi:hypothetical protein
VDLHFEPAECGDFAGSAQGYGAPLPSGAGASMSTLPPTGSIEDARSAIDPPAGLPPAEIGTALRGADAAFRAALAVAWIALGLQAHAFLWMKVLAGLAVLSLVGIAPRLLTALGTAVAVWIATAVWSVGAAIGLVVLGALRLRLHLGGAGRWLRDVRRLERRRAAALVATGLALARPDAGALAVAGDRYEQEGRLRAALVARGARPAAVLAPLSGWATRVGHMLARWPGLFAALDRAALRGSE